LIRSTQPQADSGRVYKSPAATLALSVASLRAAIHTVNAGEAGQWQLPGSSPLDLVSHRSTITQYLGLNRDNNLQYGMQYYFLQFLTITLFQKVMLSQIKTLSAHTLQQRQEASFQMRFHQFRFVFQSQIRSSQTSYSPCSMVTFVYLVTGF
jgi:hypothetical protein